MRYLLFAAAIVLASAVAVIAVHEPCARIWFSVREPSFKAPLRQMTVRNDNYGDGHFGAKRRGGRTHTGVDLVAPEGAPVYASKSGIAFRARVPRGYGKYVVIAHPDGTETWYAHLSRWEAATGQRVRQGDVIGYAGKTGNASRVGMKPHLHFEVRKGGEPVDPSGLIR